MIDNVIVNNVIEEFDRFGILPHTLPNAIGMWPNEQECLVWCALQSNPNYNWLEIGSFCGGSTVLLALLKSDFETQSKIISVDNNFNPLFNYNVYSRGRFYDIVKKIECHSQDILHNIWQAGIVRTDIPSLSFIFLDGWHSFSAIINEFTLLQPIMTNDCVIGFHDVSPSMCYTSNQTHITDGYEYAINNWGSLMTSETQDFRLDEAISFICRQYEYHIIDIPIRNNETHFQETHLTEWVRGETSPFNSFTAIQKIDY